ncbi:uncharacterized protein LOC125520379 [Triticum urartu]|uniref:uncharacterized protein LOC125520379 n=1 Tax=Triticum urartu TaxID=4572 RepID=UPI002044297C|nr:uncharacterized protein LOC125520379 [Triticum urartu]
MPRLWLSATASGSVNVAQCLGTMNELSGMRLQPNDGRCLSDGARNISRRPKFGALFDLVGCVLVEVTICMVSIRLGTVLPGVALPRPATCPHRNYQSGIGRTTSC